MQNKIKNLKEHCIMFFFIFEAAASDSAIYLSSHAGKTNLLPYHYDHDIPQIV
jgi:hypothetical protein